MTRAYDYQSYRPSAHDTRRELSAAGQLSDSVWHTSAQALEDFLTRTYKTSEVERALADAVVDKRFGPPGVSNQRNNLKLYFAVSRLMQKYGVRQLPWSQRELDRLTDDFAREPSIRELDVDFRSIMHKLVRNGAFDHLAGLTTTIVSTQYLPGVKRLMERRQGEYVTNQPNESRSTSRISDRPTPAPPAAPAKRQKSPTRAGVEIPKEAPKEPTQKLKEPSKRPIVTKENPVERPKAAPQPTTTNTTTKTLVATVESPREAISTVSIQFPSTYKVIVEEGLEPLSQASTMPFGLQWDLFNDVLRALERSCFFWASRVVPEVLKKNKWTEWQQVVILQWLEYFALPDTPLNISPEARSSMVDKTIPGLKKMYDDCNNRKPLPVDAVDATIEHAQALFKALEDGACVSFLNGIRNSLTNTGSRSTETRSRLKLEFQQAAVTINQQYMRMMELELKEKAAAMNAELKHHLESCDWGSKFFAPSDDYYQILFSRAVRPGNAISATHSVGSDTGIERTSSPRGVVIPANTSETNGHFVANTTNATQANTSGYQSESTGSTVIGSLRHEQFWVDNYGSKSRATIHTGMIPQALGLSDKAWEDFQHTAIKIMEQHDLTDVRAKDQNPKLDMTMQAFRAANQHIFQHAKTRAFADLICWFTFKVASRDASHLARRAKAQQTNMENDSSETRDPRILAYGARSAGAARRLEALKTASTSAGYPPPIVEFPRPSRPGAVEFFESKRSTGPAPAKRSLSPVGDRDDVQKRIKLEPLSQDDLILLEPPIDAEIDAAAFEAAMRQEAMMPSIESSDLVTKRSSFSKMPDRPFSTGGSYRTFH